MLRIPLTIAAIALAAPAFAQATPAPADPTTATTAPAPAAAAAASTKADVTVGKKVVDGTGADVGTIESVANGVATLSTGTHKVGVPVGSFAASGDKLAVALTKDQVNAQGAPATTPSAAATGAAGAATASADTPATTTASAAPTGAPAAGAAATTTASAAAPAAIAVGAKVNDSTGAPVGTVKAVNGDMVTVASATASAQLPKKSFAANGDALVIGLTAAQFETAAKAAGGTKGAASKG